MQSMTVPRFASEIYQEDLELYASAMIVSMFERYGLSPARIQGMALRPRERSDIQELARVMARNMIDQERVQRVCTPDPVGAVGAHDTIR